jgi:hypothetical protein
VRELKPWATSAAQIRHFCDFFTLDVQGGWLGSFF